MKIELNGGRLLRKKPLKEVLGVGVPELHETQGQPKGVRRFGVQLMPFLNGTHRTLRITGHQAHVSDGGPCQSGQRLGGFGALQGSLDHLCGQHFVAHPGKLPGNGADQVRLLFFGCDQQQPSQGLFCLRQLVKSNQQLHHILVGTL